MQSVAVNGRLLVGKENDIGETGTISSGQKPKAASKADPSRDSSDFEKLMGANGQKAEDTAAVNTQTGEEKKQTEDTGLTDETAAVSAVITQLAPLAANLQQGAITGGEGIPAQIPAGDPTTAVAAITAEQVQPEGAAAVLKNAADAAEAAPVPTGQTGDPLAVGQNTGNENTQKTQETDAGASQTQPAQGSFTEKLKETFKSMADDGSGSFDSSVAKESEPLRAKAAETDKDGPALGNLSFAETGVGAASTAAASEKPAAVERLASRIIDDFSSVRAGSSEIRIQLEPYELGAVTITVLRTASGITAKIKSEDREICSLISDQIQKLVLNMQEKGIEVKDVDVIYGKLDENMSFAQNGSGENNRQENRAFKLAAGDKKQEMADISELRDLLQGDLAAGPDTSRRIEYRV